MLIYTRCYTCWGVALSGKTHTCPKPAAAERGYIRRRRSLDGLTFKERRDKGRAARRLEAMTLVAKGLSPREIADELKVPANVVVRWRNRIFKGD